METETLYSREKAPLATKLRPETLEEIIGQPALADNAPLKVLIEADKLSSIILWGPAGTGKTTIARVIATRSERKFVEFNATTASVKDIRKEGNLAAKMDSCTVLFVDEVHRLTTVQQDALLPFVENGDLIFIGATTENPFHSVNSALISRSSIFGLEPLSIKSLYKILLRGVGYFRDNGQDVSVEEDAAKRIVTVSCGDARKVLSILEMAVEVTEDLHITLEVIKAVAPSKYLVFGNSEHFDFVSWMQGAIQASDPDAAVFALSKALEAGEDPRYLARRIMVSASEDAAGSPEAAMLAHSAYVAACEIGRPECDIIMSHAVVVTACCPRDKSAAMAIWSAIQNIRKDVDVFVPKEMRDCHYYGAEKLGQGDYKDGMNQTAYMGVSEVYFKPPITSKYKNRNLKYNDENRNGRDV